MLCGPLSQDNITSILSNKKSCDQLICGLHHLFFFIEQRYMEFFIGFNMFEPMFQNDLMDRKHEGSKLKRYLSCIHNLLDILQRGYFPMIRTLINKDDSEQQLRIVCKANSCYKDYVLKRLYRMYDNILIAKSGNILYISANKNENSDIDLTYLKNTLQIVPTAVGNGKKSLATTSSIYGY